MVTMILVEFSHGSNQNYITIRLTVSHGSINNRSMIVGSLVVSNMLVEHSIIHRPYCIIYSQSEQAERHRAWKK